MSDNKFIAFMEEYERETVPNLFCNRERILKGNIALECNPFNNAIHIAMMHALETGKGHGSTGLRWLCWLADKYDVAVTLNVTPLGRVKVLDRNQLEVWYRRYGFTNLNGTMMMRRPNERKAA